MNKTFKKCGSGDNVCNCTSADECGYSLPYENTTKKSLAECKDEVARKYNYPNWDKFINDGLDEQYYDSIVDEVFYASQFVKKDEQPDGYVVNGSDFYKSDSPSLSSEMKENAKLVYFNPVNKDEPLSASPCLNELIASINVPKKDEVSSDVDPEIQEYLNSPEYIEKRNKLIDKVDSFVLREFTDKYINEHCLNYSEKEKTIVRNSIQVGYLITSKRQSTQQPATINFFSDEEFLEIASECTCLPSALNAYLTSFRLLQSKLKERVNCVDPVGFLKYTMDKGCRFPFTDEFIARSMRDYRSKKK